MSAAKAERPSVQGERSYRSLYSQAFQSRINLSVYAQKPITQAEVNRFPRIVRLANEDSIKKLGFEPGISKFFRFQAKIRNLLDKQVNEKR